MKKKNIILLIVIVIVAIIFIYYQVVSMQNKKKDIIKYNSEFEKYTKTQIYGTDIATIINKATDINERNKISKDENGYYIEDEENSIIIELEMINREEITTYKMEQISKLGIEKFLSSEFNLIYFQCKEIEYHPNGKISKMTFTQLEN